MLVIDCFLFALIALLNSPIFTGLKIHEITGIIFLLPFFVHLLLSWKWIAQSIRYFLLKSTFKKKVFFFLNFFLFTFCVLTISSGIMISQFLLPYTGISTINDYKWRALHNQASIGIVIVASIHIAINWKRLISYFKKRVENSGRPQRAFLLMKSVARTLLILWTALMITLVSILILSKPRKDRLYDGNDIVRLKYNMIHGSIQYFGTIIAFVIMILIVRKIMQIKL